MRLPLKGNELIPAWPDLVIFLPDPVGCGYTAPPILNNCNILQKGFNITNMRRSNLRPLAGRIVRLSIRVGPLCLEMLVALVKNNVLWPLYNLT